MYKVSAKFGQQEVSLAKKKEEEATLHRLQSEFHSNHYILHRRPTCHGVEVLPARRIVDMLIF
jgi:hypothetical protein